MTGRVLDTGGMMMNKNSPPTHHTEYREDGTILLTRTKEANGDGAEVYYHSNGEIGYVRYWMKGYLTGPQLNFDNKGVLESVTTWVHGREEWYVDELEAR